ncbi:MAG: hypothetical protein K6E70_01495 [Butyrivibrio sp.]|nr:hypothetical protein [Butyrivibrio sp.]
MKQFFKIGAAAMALALSVTMVTPLTANAEVIDTWEKDADGHEIHTFKNEDTGDSLSQKDYDIKLPQAKNVLGSELKKLTITIGSFNEIQKFDTTRDVERFTNFRCSNKDLKVKVIQKLEIRNLGEEQCDADYKSKDGNTWYYKDVDGKIISVDKAKAATDMPKGNNEAYYNVRFYTKKKGTYTVKYDAILKKGGKVTKSLKVIAKEDGKPFKSVTYAGMNVFDNSSNAKDAGNRLWEKGFGYGVTSKKSGALKVVMNPDFKLKKIEIGEPSIEYKNTNEEKYEMVMDYTETNSSLNKYEEKTISWKKIKNGKVIKLKKVDDGYAGLGKLFEWGWEFGKKSKTTYTYIRITYRDKKNGETKREVFTIQLVQK